MSTSPQDDVFLRVSSIDAPDEVNAICFSPDGTLIAVAAGDKVHVYTVPEKFRNSKRSEQDQNSR